MRGELRFSQIIVNLKYVKPLHTGKILLVLFLCFLGIACDKRTHQDSKTVEYIKNLDILKFKRNGSDFTNPKYSPLRLGKPIEQIDRVYDYDFERLARTEERLEGIDRKRVLRHIFETITKGSTTNKEKHLRILKFLQRSSFNNYIQPMYSNGTAVYDPLVLLELSEMRCGQVNRIAVDLFASVGIKGRMVQVGHHIMAEVFYDGSWHYLDGDIFGNGEIILNPDGSIPSFAELSRTPYLIDSLAHFFELSFQGNSNISVEYPYPSYFYFGKSSYVDGTIVHYYKTATEEQERNKLYGWNVYETIKDNERQLYDMNPFYQPGAVIFQRICRNASEKDALNVLIEWNEAQDPDNDLLGYKVYISENSRNWSYNKFRGPDALRKFWNNTNGWKPEMYERLYQEPPHEAALIRTDQTYIKIPIEPSDTYFITVMPFDAHGESVGKVLYRMSEEIKISLPLLKE